MKTVNIHFAKTHLSRLIEEVAAGEDIVIAKAGKPVARLSAIGVAQHERKLGALAGRVKESKGAWDSDPETESLFYGPDVEPVPARRVAERRKKVR